MKSNKICIPFANETEKKQQRQQPRRECPGWKINESTENVNVATTANWITATERKHMCVCASACIVYAQSCKQFLVKSLTHS